MSLSALLTREGWLLSDAAFLEDDLLLVVYYRQAPWSASLCTLSLTTGALTELTTWSLSAQDFCYTNMLSFLSTNPVLVANNGSGEYYAYDVKTQTVSEVAFPENFYGWGFPGDGFYCFDSQTDAVLCYGTDGKRSVYYQFPDLEDYVINDLYAAPISDRYLLVQLLSTWNFTSYYGIYDMTTETVVRLLPEDTYYRYNRHFAMLESFENEQQTLIPVDPVLIATGQGTRFSHSYDLELDVFQLTENYVITMYTEARQMHFILQNRKTGNVITAEKFSYQGLSSLEGTPYYDGEGYEEDGNPGIGDGYGYEEDGNPGIGDGQDIWYDEDYGYGFSASLCTAFLSPSEERMLAVYAYDDTSIGVLLWDLTCQTATAEEPQLATLSRTDSLLLTTESVLPELIDYKGLQARADRIHEQYGFRVYFMKNIYTDFNSYTCEACCDTDMVNEALDLLEHVLAQFPKHFFEPLVTNGYTQCISLYLTGTIYRNTDINTADAMAFTGTSNNCDYLVFDLNYMYDLERTYWHEISHVLYRYIEHMEFRDDINYFDEDYFNSLNPEGFAYYEAYTDDYGNSLYNDDSYSYFGFYEDPEEIYFIDGYAKTYLTEDLSRLVEYFYVPENYGYPQDYLRSSHTVAKINYYLSVIEALWDCSMPAFSTAN